jgi:hypothetical protein
MPTNREDNIGEIVTDLDDLKTTVEELRSDPPDGIDPGSIERLENALDKASAATDELEEQRETET